MTITPTPTVTPRIVRGETVWSLIVDGCPYCGKRHYHGGGNGSRPYFGHRVADCHHVGGYVLLAPAERNEATP